MPEKNEIIIYTTPDGEVYQVDYHNLDIIISVGYRVNSKKS